MRHREHERDRRDRAEPEALEGQRPQPQHNVLALQRSAGNQAVAAMLAREPVAEETKGGAEKEAGVGTVKLSTIGVIPILSFNVGGRSDGKGGPAQPTEFNFTAKLGAHSTKLMEAMVKGTVLDGEIDVQGYKIKLSKVVVSQYQASTNEGEPHESWTLTPQSAHFDDGSGGGGGGGGGRSDWDLGGGQPG